MVTKIHTVYKSKWLGFLGFFGLKAIPGILTGELNNAIWLVWFIWFVYFFTGDTW